MAGISRREAMAVVPLAAGAPISNVPQAAGASSLNLQEPATASIGNLLEPVRAYAKGRRPRLSYLEPRFQDVERWKAEARAAYRERLAYEPGRVESAARKLGEERRAGYVQESLMFRTSAQAEVAAVFLKPDRPLKGRPGLVALHDHGGFYYLGKEKIVENPDEPEVLRAFRQRTYEGRAFASEYARAGFAVLVIDAFYFGSRRLRPESLPAGRAESLKGLTEGSGDYILASNRLAGSYENLMAKTIFLAGTTWPGMLAWDDMRSVDYLRTRPDVDAERIGCVGLSGGGMRAAVLAGMHAGIRSSVVCCFMSSAAEMLHDDVEHHTWMMHVPHAYEVLDLPDVVSMTAPNALLVQYGTRDALFGNAGQRASAEKLKAVYRKAGCEARFRGSFHDAPHGFGVAMQREALEWLKETLG